MDRILSTIGDLSSDRLEGRLSETKSGELVSEYIAAQFSSIGPKPAGENRTFSMRFSVPLWQLTKVPRLELVDARAAELSNLLVRALNTSVSGVSFRRYCISPVNFMRLTDDCIICAEDGMESWATEHTVEAYVLWLRQGTLDGRRILYAVWKEAKSLAPELLQVLCGVNEIFGSSTQGSERAPTKT